MESRSAGESRREYGVDAPDVAWRPGPEAEESRPARLVRLAGASSLDALQAHAVADPAWFWAIAADELQIAWQRRPTQVLDLSAGIPFARWWSGGAFNWGEAAVGDRGAEAGASGALTWEGEDGEVTRFSRATLRAEVARATIMLERQGVGEGSRVAIFLPMLPETVIAVLALARLRAVFTPIFSGYAAPAVATRLRAFESTHLLTADGFLRRGRAVEMKQVADEAVAQSPSVERVVVVQRIGRVRTIGSTEPRMEPGRDVWWHQAMAEVATEQNPARANVAASAATASIATTSAAPAGPPHAETPLTDPETPYMVIYTSGTTGVPKGTVHVHGGFPIKAAQDLAHVFGLEAGDRLFWLTDLGWMMGPWAIAGALLLGAELVIYEGAPDYPASDRLWAIAERHRVSHMGVSPTLIRALMVHGDEPVRSHDLSSLRVLGSTGEPWNPDPWWWFFRTVGGGRLPIVNYTGGTEISGGILGCTITRPIKPASFNGPCVGMAADVVDAAGLSVRGEVGELAIRGPWPGTTRAFWPGDEAGRERYLDTYWRRDGAALDPEAPLWIHGDWAFVDRDGYWYLHGRSDDTLKVAGKRVGPAEVEAAVVAHPAVVEAAAIGIPHQLKGEAVAILAVVRPGVVDDPDLRRSIARRVVEELGPTLRPEVVAIVPELPRTRSGKIMRRVARAAFLGNDPGDTSSLENPSAVTGIRAASPVAHE